MNKIIAGFVAAVATATVLAPVSHADTVFVGGTGTGYVPQGSPQRLVEALVPSPGVITSVLYDGSPVARPGASAGVVLQAIEAAKAPTTVVGVSKGAQVARAAEAKDTNPNTQYVFIADPDDDNGISRRLGISPPKRPLTHDTTIVVGEYDGVGDLPDRPNPLAIVNAIVGWGVIHTQYGTGSADDPLTRLDEAKVTTSKNPNGTTVTRKFVPTKNLPILKAFRDTELTLTHQSSMVDGWNKALKPVVDSGYSRNDASKAGVSASTAPLSSNDKVKSGNKVEPKTKAPQADTKSSKTEAPAKESTDNDSKE